MKLEINNELMEQYNEIKKCFIAKLCGGYRAIEVSKLKDLGFSDDDIFIAEMLGVYKGVLKAKWLK